MKRIPPFAAPPVIALAASLMLGTAALAQETTTDPAPVVPEAGAVDETMTPATPAEVDAPAATAPALGFEVPEGYAQVSEWTTLTADQLMGATLYAADGKNMGSISDLVLSQDGPVQGIVADVGGFLGMGTHRINLGHDQVNLYRNEGGTVIAATTLSEETLKALPAWEPAQ